MIVDEEVYLEHYGVKGMQWGVRKDRKSGKSNSKAGLTDEEFANVATITAIIGLYGGMAIARMQDGGTFRRMSEKGKRFVNRKRSRSWKADKSLAKKSMPPAKLMSDVVRPINHGYGSRGTKMNCRRCTFAYEMRRRGHDVVATKSKWATGQDDNGLADAINTSARTFESPFGQKRIEPKTIDYSKDIYKNLSKEPSGARGELGLQWRFGGGHSIAWENVKGKPIIFDTQNGKMYDTPAKFTSAFPPNTMDHAAYTRLDNVELNDDFLLKWVQNAA